MIERQLPYLISALSLLLKELIAVTVRLPVHAVFQNLLSRVLSLSSG